MSLNRRRHRLFVTRHTEYHLRADECVGVRDRESGAWLRDHAALRLHAIKLPPTGHDHVWLGQRIQFWSSNTDVVTSPVVAVGRPGRDCLDHYTSLSRAGTISC
ncbi:MAG: hypothetical protein IAG13_29510 [Deltaproteobacteria bacterium]|nr:hypothetical protein [Nannocystaceae bacterium]